MDGLAAVVDERPAAGCRANRLTPLGFSRPGATPATPGRAFRATSPTLAPPPRRRRAGWYREKTRRDNALAAPRGATRRARRGARAPPRRPAFWHTFPFPSTAYISARRGWRRPP